MGNHGCMLDVGSLGFIASLIVMLNYEPSLIVSNRTKQAARLCDHRFVYSALAGHLARSICAGLVTNTED